MNWLVHVELLFARRGLIYFNRLLLEARASGPDQKNARFQFSRQSGLVLQYQQKHLEDADSS